MLFSIQYSSAKCWLDSGLQVKTLIGHSFGQLTALCVAESLSLHDTIRLIAGRARLIRDKWDKEAGVMLSLEGNQTQIEMVVDSINSNK
jgi:acyl transferase domain-containing protein